MGLTRVWSNFDDELLGRVDELGKSGSYSRGHMIEKMVRAECARPIGALTVELSPDVLAIVKDMAIAQKRTVDAQAAWIVEEFCKKGKRNG
jgi:predicted transcriptional regulator